MDDPELLHSFTIKIEEKFNIIIWFLEGVDIFHSHSLDSAVVSKDEEVKLIVFSNDFIKLLHGCTPIYKTKK